MSREIISKEKADGCACGVKELRRLAGIELLEMGLPIIPAVQSIEFHARSFAPPSLCLNGKFAPDFGTAYGWLAAQFGKLLALKGAPSGPGGILWLDPIGTVDAIER